MHIIAFSDLHIAHKMIDQDVLDNLVKDIKRLARPDSIICFCGDLMHKRVELNDVYAQQAVVLFKEIDELNIPTFVIEGTFSHDYQYIDTFKKIGLKNFTFIQTMTELNVKNNTGEEISMLCIPEEYVEDQVEYYKDTVYNKKKKYDLVMMHGTFTDVLFHNVSIEAETLRKAPKFDSSDFSRHLLTLSGHIHKHQVLGKKKNVIYVGSYSMMNFGEDKSNNILSIELDTKEKTFNMEVIENTASQTFEDIEINEKNISDFEKVILPKIKNKSIRHNIRVYANIQDLLILNVLKELKKDGYIRSLVTEKIDTKTTNETETKEEGIDYSQIYSGNIENQIQLFIKEKYGVELDTEKIKNYINA